MKPFTAVLLTATLALVAGCANTLPKPTNAAGGINASVAVAEAEITYRNAAHDATVYVSTCHTAPTTQGCSEKLIANIKLADDKAWQSITSAENAVRTLAPGSSGIDAAIAGMQAALVFLQGFVTQIPAALKRS